MFRGPLFEAVGEEQVEAKQHRKGNLHGILTGIITDGDGQVERGARLLDKRRADIKPPFIFYAGGEQARARPVKPLLSKTKESRGRTRATL